MEKISVEEAVAGIEALKQALSDTDEYLRWVHGQLVKLQALVLKLEGNVEVFYE